MNLLFCINRDFIWLWKRCMQSILLNGGGEDYQVFILHSDLTAEDTGEISDFLGPRARVCFITVPEEMFEGFPESGRYPRQIYYRLAAPLLLPKELDRILYLDVDLVVINPLTDFYHSDFEQAGFMACSHSAKWLDRVNQLRLGIEKDVPYLNSGVMLINLAQEHNPLLMKQLQEYAEKYRRRLLLPDQDILTALAGDMVKVVNTLKYNLNDRILNWYNLDPTHPKIDLEWVRQNGVIIHYFGKNKPWKPNYRGCLDVFYHQVDASLTSSPPTRP